MLSYKEQLEHPLWQSRRLEILKKYENTCAYCDTKDCELHIHHKYYRKGALAWEYPDTCLVCLCAECHLSEESELKEIHANMVMELRELGFTSYMLKQLMSSFKSIEDGDVGNFNILINDLANLSSNDRLAFHQLSERINDLKIKLKQMPNGEAF